MENRETPRKHPWKVYLMAGALLNWGGDWLAQYLNYGYVVNWKEQVIYNGRDGLTVSLVLLLAGLVILSAALWSSYKVYNSRKKDT